KVRRDVVYVSEVPAGDRTQLLNSVLTTIHVRSPAPSENCMNRSRPGAPTAIAPALRLDAISTFNGTSSSFGPVNWTLSIVMGTGPSLISRKPNENVPPTAYATR